MKRTTMFAAAALVAALAFGAMAGCSSQQASSASASSASSASASAASASASASSAESQEAIIAELKESLANVPTYKSVTVGEKTWTLTNGEAEAGAGSSSAAAASSEAASSEAATSKDAAADIEGIASRTIYKFDASGDKLKTSADFEMDDIKIKYFTDGDDAVCVTDGPIYSGTVEQFDLSYAAGADEYIKTTIGDLNTLLDCAATVTKNQVGDLTAYELVLDAEKYIASDEILKIMADSGSAVKEAFVSVGFDKNGHIASMSLTMIFDQFTSVKILELSDFDSTVIDPMPEATNTYEEMEADIQAKLSELANELDLTESAEN